MHIRLKSMHMHQPSNRGISSSLAFQPSVILFILFSISSILLFINDMIILLIISISDFIKKTINKHIYYFVLSSVIRILPNLFRCFFFVCVLFLIKLSIDRSLLCSMSRNSSMNCFIFRMFNIVSNGPSTKQFELFD
jgi:hypothetical protein